MSAVLKIVLPMAGLGTRLRPHTWSRPKQLLQVAGKPLLHHVLQSLHSLPPMLPREYIFITGHKGEQIRSFSAEAYPEMAVRYAEQHDLLGQSHALYQARQFIAGPVLLVFSDTLIETDLAFLAEPPAEALAWVRDVPDPRRFGVARLDAAGKVQEIIEKPSTLDYRMAVVGFYYFPDGEELVDAIEEQLVKDVRARGEFYLADAVNILLKRGLDMRTLPVRTWMDAGSVESLLETNAYLLENGQANFHKRADGDGLSIIPPVFIDPAAQVEGSVIGPYVSIGAGARIENSILRNTIVEDHADIQGCELTDSLVGQRGLLRGVRGIISIGDDSRVESG